MSTQSITISPKEIETLLEWINQQDPKPHKVEITATHTGIGSSLRVEYETSDTEGKYKDITDYENW